MCIVEIPKKMKSSKFSKYTLRKSKKSKRSLKCKWTKPKAAASAPAPMLRRSPRLRK